MASADFHVLGIDAGGTKTVCQLAGPDGTIISEARGAGANLQAGRKFGCAHLGDTSRVSEGGEVGLRRFQGAFCRLDVSRVNNRMSNCVPYMRE